MRGAPKWLLHAHPRIDARSSVSICGRPPNGRTSNASSNETGPVPTHEGLGPSDCENLQDRRKPAIELDQELAIIVRKPDATIQPTPHHIQPISRHGVAQLQAATSA
jgi:hypothetical protein